jgi:L,D-transpeptidase YcbB
MHSRVAISTLMLCFAGASIAAGEPAPPAAASALERHSNDSPAPVAPPASQPASTAVPVAPVAAPLQPVANAAQPAAIVAPAAPQPPPPEAAAAVEPPAPAGPIGFAVEFAARLDPGRLGAADRADRAALARFYEQRQQEPHWVTPTGLSAAAVAVIAEIKRADDWGLDASTFRVPAVRSGPELTRDQRADAEIMLGLAILKYARHARGGRTDPASLSKYIDRKPQIADPARVIEDAAKSDKPAAFLRGLHPRHPQFELLRQRYLALRRGQPVAQAEPPPPPRRARRYDPYEPAPVEAAPPPPPEVLGARRLLVNMEQWRWMPEDLGTYHVWVNIPEFMIRVVKGGRAIHTERVIVGKPDTQTPVFSDKMEQVIFQPFWGVPDSIKKNEIQPSLARGGMGVLERHNLRIQHRGRDIDPASVDWASADMRNFHVYQPPGETNVLGVVKFRFPNKHDVYMHDTPQRNLFNVPVRAYSHGCMRVRDPVRLAELILAEDKGWQPARVAAAVTAKEDNQINLSRKFPVHMTYFTAWVEEDGRLQLYGDLYGHESRISLGMEGKAHLIPRHEDKAPVRAEAVSNLNEAQGRYAPQSWMRRVFDN